MSSSFVLVHSPLVGAVTWSWTVDELTRLGQQVVVPDLREGSVAGRWQTCVDAAVHAVHAVGTEHDVVLVGHSGAGPLLPVIADRLPTPPAQLVFVDAGVPPLVGWAELMPPAFLDQLGDLALDGILPPWSDWFGPGVMDALVPAGDRRAAVVDALPLVPVSYFQTSVPMPDGWSEACATSFVLLSDAYRADADEAAQRGWPVVELLGGHLDVVTRPEAVAAALHDLAEAPSRR